MATRQELRTQAISQVSDAVKGLGVEAQTIAIQAVGRAADPQSAAASLASTAAAVQPLQPQGQAAAMQAQADGFPEPDPATANDLWRAVVYGLLTVLVIGLIGIIVLIATGKAPDQIVTAFTATLTGILGLFAVPSKTPGSKSTTHG